MNLQFPHLFWTNILQNYGDLVQQRSQGFILVSKHLCNIWIEKHQKSKEKWVLEFTFCYKQKESLLPSQYLHISTSAIEWI